MTGAAVELGSVADIATAVGHARVRAVEVVEMHLTRVDAVNPRVRAITHVLRERALRAAEEVDRAVAAGATPGPLAGVPFSVKEHLGVAGAPTTMGVAALRHVASDHDAIVVERLCAAGAIPIARTNLPDLSLRVHTRSQLYGETHNPWNEDVSPGGSSGGDAVAVACRMVAFGVGSDAGGSVRLPALFGGIAALKPSSHRVPDVPAVGPRDLTLASQTIPVIGPLARRVDDLRRIFAVIAGPDPRDPRVVPVPLEGAPPYAMRVGVVLELDGVPIEGPVLAAVERAASVLRDSGLEVHEVRVPRLAETLDAYGRMIMTEMQSSWPMLSRLLGEDGRRYLELAMARTRPATLDEYLALTALRQGLVREWVALLETHPVLVGPVFARVSMQVGEDVAGPSQHAHVSEALALCAATSFLGLPAVAVPVGLHAGLPLGVQVIAAPFREDRCLEIASRIEAGVGVIAPPV